MIQTVVEAIFTPIGGPPRFIDGTEGEYFIARDRENDPLVRRFYIPVCALVSPKPRSTEGLG